MVSPPALDSAAERRLIEDRYLRGTRLRLRRVTHLPDGPVEHKLGQKVRPDPTDPGLVLHTTMYLSGSEHDRMGQLPGAELRKVRHVFVLGDRAFGVDVFEGRHSGLVLAEVELAGSEEGEPPPFAGPEVTADERFTGGGLAFASDDALAAVLRAGG